MLVYLFLHYNIFGFLIIICVQELVPYSHQFFGWMKIFRPHPADRFVQAICQYYHFSRYMSSVPGSSQGEYTVVLAVVCTPVITEPEVSLSLCLSLTVFVYLFVCLIFSMALQNIHHSI